VLISFLHRVLVITARSNETVMRRLSSSIGRRFAPFAEARRTIKHPGDTSHADNPVKNAVQAERAASAVTFQRNHESPTGEWAGIDTSFFDLATDIDAPKPLHGRETLNALWDEVLDSCVLEPPPPPAPTADASDGATHGDDGAPNEVSLVQSVMQQAAFVASLGAKKQLANALLDELIRLHTLDSTVEFSMGGKDRHMNSGPNYEFSGIIFEPRRRFFAVRQMFIDAAPILFPPLEQDGQPSDVSLHNCDAELVFTLGRVIQLFEACITLRRNDTKFKPISWDHRPAREYEAVDISAPLKSLIRQFNAHIGELVANPPQLPEHRREESIDPLQPLIDVMIGLRSIATRLGIDVDEQASSVSIATLMELLNRNDKPLPSTPMALIRLLPPDVPRFSHIADAQRSKDAEGVIRDIVRRAVHSDLNGLGMADSIAYLKFVRDLLEGNRDYFAKHTCSKASDHVPDVGALLAAVTARIGAFLRVECRSQGPRLAQGDIDPLQRFLSATQDAAATKQRDHDGGIPYMDRLAATKMQKSIVTLRPADASEIALIMRSVAAAMPASMKWALDGYDTLRFDLLRWVDMPNSRGSIMSNSTQAASVLHGLHALAGGASSDKLKKIAGTLATARGGAATLHNVLRACDKAMSEHARRAPLDDLVKTLSAFSEHSYAPRCLPVVQTSLLQFAPGAFSLDQIDACITAFLRLDPSAGMMWLQVMAPRVCELLQALLTHSGDVAAVETSVRLMIAYTVGKCNASPLVVASVGDAVLNATATADVTPALASSYADMLHAISETSASSQRVPRTELARLAAVADRVTERMDTDAFFAVADVSVIALVVMCLPRLHQLTRTQIREHRRCCSGPSVSLAAARTWRPRWRRQSLSTCR
jgi:hypothetical protein